jgi:hypothetical protein
MWQDYVQKRARENKRLVSVAATRLQRDYAAPVDMPKQARLGVHLGLITLANCSDKVVDVRWRARWILDWMFGYLISQGFTVQDATDDNALDALELMVVAAVQAKEKQPNQLCFRLGQLVHADGTPVENTWTDVYNVAWKFISALRGVA